MRKRFLIATLTTLVVVLAVAQGAAAGNTGVVSAVPAGTPTAAPGDEVTTTQTTRAGVLNVTYRAGRLFRSNGALMARGTVRMVFQATSGETYTQAKSVVWRARVLQQRPNICQVLFLTLGPLDLSLLGLNVHLDRITLRITANRRGGILGQLLCGLAGRSLNTRAGVSRWNQRVGSIGNVGSASAVLDHLGTCPVLNLVLGPLDLRVLGLRVQLSRVRLVITAERGHGILGDLLCGLAGGVLPTPTPPPLPTP
jgi:hypothetical protein